MPVFKSTEEAHKAHENYHIDTDLEGKYRKDNFNLGRLRVEWLIDQVEPGTYGLEVGCNSGGLCKRIQDEKKAYMKGLDICEDLVERAKAKGVSAMVGKAEKLPYRPNTFEFVVMTEVMEHLFEPKVVLNEIYRVLRPGGKFIGSVPHPESHNTKKRPLEDHDYHCHVFDTGELVTLLDNFEHIMIHPIHWTTDFEKHPQWNCWSCRKGVEG